MNILLTGGAGYIGSHAAYDLIDNNHNVTVIDNLVNGDKNLIPTKADFLNCDIADKEKVEILLKKSKFDVVMHFAGFTRVGESVKKPEKYFENNVEKPKIFFSTCIKYNLNNIIFSSTGSVYGNVNSQINIKENHEKNPINPYSSSKLKLENYLLDLSKQKKINAIILRYFNVAGADNKLRSGLTTNPDNLIKAICEVAIGKREKLIIFGKDYKTKDGTTIRDFIHVSDLAEIHTLAANHLIQKKKSNIFNCGYGKGFSINDVVRETNKILSNDLPIEYGPRREGDAEYSVSDNTKFVNEFQWTPKFNNLRTIIETSLNWEKKLKNFR